TISADNCGAPPTRRYLRQISCSCARTARCARTSSSYHTNRRSEGKAGRLVWQGQVTASNADRVWQISEQFILEGAKKGNYSSFRWIRLLSRNGAQCGGGT